MNSSSVEKYKENCKQMKPWKALERPNEHSDASSENTCATHENSTDATVPEGGQVQFITIRFGRASRPKKLPAKLASRKAKVQSGSKYVAKNKCGNCINKKV